MVHAVSIVPKDNVMHIHLYQSTVDCGQRFRVTDLREHAHIWSTVVSVCRVNL